MDGILNVNKPLGITSHDVVARVRRLTRQKRVGHTGTLDPAASGVLPICLGQATRVAEYLGASGKAYRATVRFGMVTDTYDAEGTVVRTAPVELVREAIMAALPEFLGPQMQVPPLYSAIKRAGQPLYKLARAGESVELAPRPVMIYALTLVSWGAPDLVLDVECGKGTYIRSLAFDLGERLGPGAHLAGLVRTRSGPFTLAGSIALEGWERALADGTWQEHLYPADLALLAYGGAVLDAEQETRMRTGQPVSIEAPERVLAAGARPTNAPALPDIQHAAEETPPPDTFRVAVMPDQREPASGAQNATLIRAYAGDGRFLGILASWSEADAAWRPHKVLAGGEHGTPDGTTDAP
ncbi:MAG TPA: tRNA pseudouridine(55) synthase TruB [Ktedonobacterales bacterium]